MNEVWDRVTAGPQQMGGVAGLMMPKACPLQQISPQHDDKADLRRFMEYEAHDCAYYKAMAARCSRRAVKNMFLQMSADECRHQTRLQKMYFILTGDSYAPKVKVKPITSALTALRERYIAESEAQSGYEQAAKLTENAKLAQLYKELAVDEARHGRNIENLIEKVIG